MITEHKASLGNRSILTLPEALLSGPISFGVIRLVDLVLRSLPSVSPESRDLALAFWSALSILVVGVLYRQARLSLSSRAARRYDTEVQKAESEYALLKEREAKLNRLLAAIPDGAHGGLDDLSTVAALIEESNERRRRDETEAENREKIRNLIDSTPKLTDLLQAHLTETNGTSEAAVLSIITSLTQVKAEVQKLISSMNATTGRVDALFGDAQAKIVETGLLLDGLNDYQQKMDLKVRTAVKNVIGQISELKSFTDVIRNVNGLTNVLAINAAIEAARAGQLGAGFAVVAADVRALTTKIDSATEDMETRVVLVSQTIKEELHAIAELVRGDDDARWVSDIAHALPQLSSDFASSVRELDGFVKSTHDATRTVLEAIVNILGDAQFQDITRQQIDQVKNGLRLCGEHFRRVAERLDDDWSTSLDVESMVEATAALQAGYTMSAQRLIHQKVVDGNADTGMAGVARIELF